MDQLGRSQEQRIMEKLLTPKQLSELLRISVNTAYNWVHAKFVPHYKLGSCVRFSEEEIEKWLEIRRNKRRERFRYQDILD